MVANVERPLGSKDHLHIGEIARLCGTTTRTLRYWEEIDLLAPLEYTQGSQRLYGLATVERVGHIRRLQEVLGLSLTEIRQVIEAEDKISDLRSAFHETGSPAGRRRAVEQAIEINQGLIARLEDRLNQITAFKTEREDKASRLVVKLQELSEDSAS